MIAFVLHLVLSAALLLVTARAVSGFKVSSFGSAIFAAFAVGVVNAIVRPLVVILTLPLTILTLGLFLFVVNGFMLKIAAAVVPGFRIEGFTPAVIGSLLLSILNLIVYSLLG